MERSTSPLQPGSAGSDAASGAPDLNDPEFQQALFGKIMAACLSGRAAQDAAGGGQ